MPERDHFPRLRELADMNAAFGGFLRDADSPHRSIKQKVLRDIEADLAGLDGSAWTIFKKKAASYLSGRYTQKVNKGNLEGIELPRGWQQFFDLRNEVRAYNYLRSNDCSNVEFIREVTTETPDLKATRGNRRVLCEVKTINRSDFAIFQSCDRSYATCLSKRQDKFINARTCGNEPCTRSGVVDHQPALADVFFKK
ncbi:MAG: hypothetical protein HQL36_10845 [Alphaproteobacteria bacterium]|nr:hypothetical protein [Alphaproteobacteria bacterium]